MHEEDSEVLVVSLVEVSILWAAAGHQLSHLASRGDNVSGGSEYLGYLVTDGKLLVRLLGFSPELLLHKESPNSRNRINQLQRTVHETHISL